MKCMNLFMCAADYLEDQSDFLLIPRHQELLGNLAKDCDIPVSIESTGLEDGRHYALSYVLFRCFMLFVFLYVLSVRTCQHRGVMLNVSLPSCRRFSPEFFQGYSVEEMQLHSLLLYPLFTSEFNVFLTDKPSEMSLYTIKNAALKK